ncbi:bucentaur or craniofacial development-domain-containing protein [Astrocystis sublimbata]|nr:bucentaur or craniofacial development-domain-containing protein [Astrocystis sublimbata]
MSADPLIDEDYASGEDSDFAPDAAPVEDGSGSDSESEPEAAVDDKAVGATPKRKRNDADPAQDDFENSGDETIIQKGKKRQKKSKRNDEQPDDEEGGEGGLIKTRRQRALEKAERKSLAASGPVTINVDDVWAQLIAAPLIPPKADARHDKENHQPGRGGDEPAGDTTKTAPTNSNDGNASGMIKIKRTYNFAGKVHTEEKLVARDSAEARLYLASQDPANLAAADQPDDEQPKRKPRQAFRSIFEPVVEGLAQRADLKLGMRIRLELRDKEAKAKKLNVVEKSRMDWAGYVDKEGIKDELELAGKSKESLLNRQDFLQRVEYNKEEEARRARMAIRG